MRPFLVLALAAMPALAHAHAHLVTSVPAAGSDVAQAADIRIDYTEPVDPAKTTVALTDAAGRAVALAAPTIDPARETTLVAHVQAPLAAGAYTVAWHAVAARNGHETQGTFGFKVDPSAAEAAPADRARRGRLVARHLGAPGGRRRLRHADQPGRRPARRGQQPGGGRGAGA